MYLQTIEKNFQHFTICCVEELERKLGNSLLTTWHHKSCACQARTRLYIRVYSKGDWIISRFLWRLETLIFQRISQSFISHCLFCLKENLTEEHLSILVTGDRRKIRSAAQFSKFPSHFLGWRTKELLGLLVEYFRRENHSCWNSP